MKIVITGATGNLGTSTVEALSKDGRVSEIVGIARRKPPSNGSNDKSKARFVAADVTHDNLDELFQGAEAVIHLAWMLQPARDTERLERVNVAGTGRVLEAVSRTRVPAVVIASSVGVYSPGPKDRAVSETWGTQGIPSSAYSQQKVKVERMLDVFEEQHPNVRVVRMRPALVFKGEAGSEIRRLFIGPWLPRFLMRPGRIPFVPDVDRLRVQCIHSDDVGRAFSLAALSDASGPINLAADPVLDPETLSKTLNARRVPISAGLLRKSASLAWHLHLTPADVGWVDIALGAPLMNTDKARRVLGFEPQISSTRALLELMDGIRNKRGAETAPLHP